MEKWAFIVLPAALCIWIVVRTWKYESNKRAGHKTIEQNAKSDTCNICLERGSTQYWLYDYKFIGIALIASVSETTPAYATLCHIHAREQCLSLCKSIGKRGHWGFPGFLLAPYYVIKNIWSLKRRRKLTVYDCLACVWYGIIVGWLLLLLFFVILMLSLAGIIALME